MGEVRRALLEVAAAWVLLLVALPTASSNQCSVTTAQAEAYAMTDASATTADGVSTPASPPGALLELTVGVVVSSGASAEL